MPSLKLDIKNEQRFGKKIVIQKLSGKVSEIRSIRERTVSVNGANIFNAMPRIIREYQGDFPGFKIMVDTFLMEVPDCPILDGYTSHNMDRSNRPSNSLIDWCDNMNVINWVPGSLE